MSFDSFDSLMVQLPTSTMLLYVLVVVGSLLLVHGIFTFVSSASGKTAANRRLELLAKGLDNQEVLAVLRRDTKKETGLFGKLSSVLNFRWYSKLLRESGSVKSTKQIFLYMILLGYGTFFGLKMYVVLPTMFLACFAILVGFCLPTAFLVHKRKKRINRFSEQLPDAIDLLVRGLKVGHPLSSAFKSVADQMSDPVGTEFGIAIDEMSYGLNLRDAIMSMTQRMPSQDLHFLAVAVNIQYGSGGNLAEVLENLSKVIRDRYMMFRKARAICAEGRLTATILTFLPFGMAGLVYLINTEFYSRTFHEPLFPYIAGLAITLSILNGVVMKWITNIKA